MSGGDRVNIFTGGDAVLKWAIKHWQEPSVTSIDQLKPSVCFGISHGRRPVAACIFQEFRRGEFGNDVRLTFVSIDPIWCNRRILSHIADYVFSDIGCNRVTAIIREGNKKSERMAIKLGFRKEGVIRRGWNGKTNALIYGMLQHECRWHKEPVDGWKQSGAAAIA